MKIQNGNARKTQDSVVIEIYLVALPLTCYSWGGGGQEGYFKIQQMGREMEVLDGLEFYSRAPSSLHYCKAITYTLLSLKVYFLCLI